jgi:hypothetical protein
MLFLAIDANFRLRLKAQGIKDPELGSGWAYFVEESDYTAHIKRNMEDKDVSLFSIMSRYCLDSSFAQIQSCGSTFRAVNHANSKFSKGYAVTGVGAVVCARHNFMQPNGVDDLYYGERCVLLKILTP